MMDKAPVQMLVFIFLRGYCDEPPGYARAPSNAHLISRKVKAVIERRVSCFISDQENKLCAFRIAWSSKNTPEDLIWANIAKARVAFEEEIKSFRGISFFVSTVTATVSNQANRRDVCPALGFFIVTECADFQEAPLYIKLRNNPYGGTLKLLNDRSIRPGEDRKVAWITLLSKDNVESSYVQGKMAVQAQSHIPLVKFFIHNEHMRESVQMSMTEFQKEGFPADMEVF